MSSLPHPHHHPHPSTSSSIPLGHPPEHPRGTLFYPCSTYPGGGVRGLLWAVCGTYRISRSYMFHTLCVEHIGSRDPICSGGHPFLPLLYPLPGPPIRPALGRQKTEKKQFSGISVDQIWYRKTIAVRTPACHRSKFRPMKNIDLGGPISSTDRTQFRTCFALFGISVGQICLSKRGAPENSGI